MHGAPTPAPHRPVSILLVHNAFGSAGERNAMS